MTLKEAIEIIKRMTLQDSIDIKSVLGEAKQKAIFLACMELLRKDI